MRAGWMRPSLMSFSSASLATSLRTGSKLERVIASGVSSIIRVDARQRLQRTDIAALAADNAAFISSFGRVTTRNGRFSDMFGRAALDGEGDDLLCLVLLVLADALFIFFDNQRSLVRNLLAQRAEQLLLACSAV